MPKLIIYSRPDGRAAIVVPTPEILETRTIEEVAAKDVPAGVPYKIIDTADVPTDRTFRNAWEADMSNPDGVGADSSEFPAKEEAVKQTPVVTPEQTIENPDAAPKL